MWKIISSRDNSLSALSSIVLLPQSREKFDDSDRTFDMKSSFNDVFSFLSFKRTILGVDIENRIGHEVDRPANNSHIV